MTMGQLSVNLSEAGRPMKANTLSTVENMTRRIDVDDLIAFAVALNVSPAALLMPAYEDDDAVEMWAWITAESPRSGGTVDTDDQFAVEAWRRSQVPKFAWRRS